MENETLENKSTLLVIIVVQSVHCTIKSNIHPADIDRFLGMHERKIK